ncbi:MAG: hypothetical protein JRF61_18110 [Deltaproteobacteria bacterium]|nr:hypothetical protein [Deltaproteobacteria bacterium]
MARGGASPGGRGQKPDPDSPAQEDWGVSEDFSFPIEGQRPDARADPLRTLQHMLEQAFIGEAEYAIAKAKILA